MLTGTSRPSKATIHKKPLATLLLTIAFSQKTHLKILKLDIKCLKRPKNPVNTNQVQKNKLQNLSQMRRKSKSTNQPQQNINVDEAIEDVALKDKRDVTTTTPKWKLEQNRKSNSSKNLTLNKGSQRHQLSEVEESRLAAILQAVKF